MDNTSLKDNLSQGRNVSAHQPARQVAQRGGAWPWVVCLIGIIFVQFALYLFLHIVLRYDVCGVFALRLIYSIPFLLINAGFILAIFKFTGTVLTLRLVFLYGFLLSLPGWAYFMIDPYFKPYQDFYIHRDLPPVKLYQDSYMVRNLPGAFSTFDCMVRSNPVESIVTDFLVNTPILLMGLFGAVLSGFIFYLRRSRQRLKVQ